MHSLNSSSRYAVSIHYVPGTVLDMGDTKENKIDKNPLLHGADSP